MWDSCEISQHHAGATYDFKYGVRSVQGGGRSSARETIGRVAAGAVAHKVALPEDMVDHETLTVDQVENNIVRCPNPEYAEKMIAAIDAVRERGDSVGGVVTCIMRNVPRGLGSPVFDKLEDELAKAVMFLPATKGFEFGSGFAGTFLIGSEHNDEFFKDEQGQIRTRTNPSGGIQGISISIFQGKFWSSHTFLNPTNHAGWNTTLSNLYMGVIWIITKSKQVSFINVSYVTSFVYVGFTIAFLKSSISMRSSDISAFTLPGCSGLLE